MVRHISGVEVLVEHHAVGMAVRRFPPNQLARLRIERRDPPAMISADAHEPFSRGMKLHLLHQSLKLSIRDLVQPLSRFPVEDLDPQPRFQMVDVADRSRPSHHQLCAIR